MNIRNTILASALVLIAPLFGGCTGCGEGYHHGSHDGLLVDASKGGVIFQSYEIEVLSGVGGATKTERFSTRDETLGQAVIASLGQHCTIVYNEWLAGPSSMDSSLELSAVKNCHPAQGQLAK